MTDTEHDPFNDPDAAHPRARELLVEDFFWDCVDEEAPFGSDEGSDAYYEYRSWREEHAGAPLVDCLDWIMSGQLGGYTMELAGDEQVERDLAEPEVAFLADDFDVFTLDATVIATGFGQLLDEGRIDATAKPYIRVALTRQLHPRVVSSEHRAEILRAALRVLEIA